MFYHTYLNAWILLACSSLSWGFAPAPSIKTSVTGSSSNDHNTRLNLFDGKLFEEEGTLGKGITVGKIQISMISPDRSKTSIFGQLEDLARNADDLPELANQVCLSMLRKKDSWTGAHSSSQWFKQDDWAKAEGKFNDWSNLEASKFEKEYIPEANSEEKGGGSTVVVVSLVIEIQGDDTKFDGAGFSFAETQEILTSIASNCLVDGGECVNAVEVFWTPSERDEVLTNRDIIVDFPELVTL